MGGELFFPFLYVHPSFHIHARTIQDRNNLPQTAVEATTIDTFVSRASKPAT